MLGKRKERVDKKARKSKNRTMFTIVFAKEMRHKWLHK
jgi:hypothetical protein